jgi:tetratricopeptide (TPR) repeat protein
VRIVREVQIPNQSARFEVFHDVLGPAILEWGRKYEVHAQAAREQEVSRARRMRIGLLALSVVVIAMAGLLYWGVRQKTLVLDSQRKLEERLKEIHRLRETEEYMRRGILFSQQIKYDAAIAELRKALELDPDNASAYGFLGYAQMRHDYIPDAIASLQKSISLDPNNAQPHFNLADAYTQNRQFDSAIRELKEAFKLDCCVYCGATKTLALKAQKAFGAAASASFIKDLAGVSCVCPDKTIPCTPVSNPEP